MKRYFLRTGEKKPTVRWAKLQSLTHYSQHVFGRRRASSLGELKRSLVAAALTCVTQRDNNSVLYR